MRCDVSLCRSLCVRRLAMAAAREYLVRATGFGVNGHHLQVFKRLWFAGQLTTLGWDNRKVVLVHALRPPFSPASLSVSSHSFLWLDSSDISRHCLSRISLAQNRTGRPGASADALEPGPSDRRYIPLAVGGSDGAPASRSDARDCMYVRMHACICRDTCVTAPRAYAGTHVTYVCMDVFK